MISRCAARCSPLRLGAGGALITLAFAEKPANPALARETVRLFPDVDVFRLIGVTKPGRRVVL
ncbi:hypothetical protein [Paractinoplanes rishiriensis]|uniref:Uncharacterized protein n=1 Tax=Paractinoplanes rishiriensis TaxID=1050105 RepID=A0A919KD65_9ACTN|nr:hypothetical protein [Actinoplanes rishiriensis]GIF01877.1 hypothetical protein Ari01nite_93410 [Actinoplanes rishiriensis]